MLETNPVSWEKSRGEKVVQEEYPSFLSRHSNSMTRAYSSVPTMIRFGMIATGITLATRSKPECKRVVYEAEADGGLLPPA